MEIKEIRESKKRYLDLLLLADEQEEMVDRYLERGRMFVMTEEVSDGEDGRRNKEETDMPRHVLAECVVTREGDGVYELKNLAVVPEEQKKGYGKKMIEAVFEIFRECRTLWVGTGESPATLGFYRKCGFVYSHRIRDFFTEHYDHPIIEDGVLLKDMVYLKKERERAGHDE